MKHLSIKLKVGAAFSIMLIVVFVLGVFSVSRISAVNDLTNEMGESWVPSVELTGAINTMATKFRVAEARHIMAQTDNELRAMEKLLDERGLEIRTLRAKYEPLMSSVEERTLYNEFARAWDDYMAVHKKILVLSAAHDNAGAEALFAGESMRFYNLASSKLDALVRLNHDGAQAANLRGDEIYVFARNLVVGALVVTVLMTVAMAGFLILNVSVPVAGMTRVMARLSDNDFSVVIPATDRGDELGAMAQAVQVFKEKMEANRRMEAEVKESERRNAEQRKRDMNHLADEF
ncbi:MAG TPA: MCP four helix bundle domain-containing protein, partial [Candidatus Omnitrophota bacterium]|nr:MCP four helix bundle domain-containing protein [Candidatus Omnitrophota bacterium]